MFSPRNRWFIPAIVVVVVLAALVAVLVFLSGSRQRIGRTTETVAATAQPAVAGVTTTQTAPASQPVAAPPEQISEASTVLPGATAIALATPVVASTAQVGKQPIATTQATVEAVISQADIVLLRPDQVAASAEASSSTDSAGVVTTFVAQNTLDGQLETAWRVPGDGENQFLLYQFAAPVVLREIRLVPGYAKIDQKNGTNRFTQNRRVRSVRFEFSQGEPVEATFSEEPTLQPVALDDRTTTFVRIVLVETTSEGAVDGRDFTPISEVEIYGVQP